MPTPDQPSTLASPTTAVLAGALATLWAGMILGVSFLASPVKFSAPGLTMPVALEVGHVTFAAFNWVQGGLGVALLVLLAGWRRRAAILVGGAVLALLVLQAFWLLPALHVQTTAVLRGGSTATTALHLLYVATETAKLGLLVALGVLGLREGRGERSAASPLPPA